MFLLIQKLRVVSEHLCMKQATPATIKRNKTKNNNKNYNNNNNKITYCSCIMTFINRKQHFPFFKKYIMMMITTTMMIIIITLLCYMLYTPNKKCKNMIWLKINICILMLLHMTMDALWKIRIQKAVAAVLK